MPIPDPSICLAREGSWTCIAGPIYMQLPIEARSSGPRPFTTLDVFILTSNKEVGITMLQRNDNSDDRLSYAIR